MASMKHFPRDLVSVEIQYSVALGLDGLRIIEEAREAFEHVLRSDNYRVRFRNVEVVHIEESSS